MSFISSSSSIDPTLLRISNFEANATSAGVSIGDQISKREVLSVGGTVINVTYFNDTTGLEVTTAPAAANLTPLDDSTQDAIDTLRVSLERNTQFKPIAATVQSITNTTVAGSLITVVTGSVSTLQVINQAASTACYVGVVSGVATITSGTTPLLASVWVPAAAGTQVVLDSQFLLEYPSTTGYQIVRSSTPLIYTQLGAVLSSAQTIRTTTRL